MSASEVEFVDWILFAVELLGVLRQIRDELQKVGDRLAEIETTLSGRPF